MLLSAIIWRSLFFLTGTCTDVNNVQGECAAPAAVRGREREEAYCILLRVLVFLQVRRQAVDLSGFSIA